MRFEFFSRTLHCPLTVVTIGNLAGLYNSVIPIFWATGWEKKQKRKADHVKPMPVVWLEDDKYLVVGLSFEETLLLYTVSYLNSSRVVTLLLMLLLSWVCRVLILEAVLTGRRITWLSQQGDFVEKMEEVEEWNSVMEKKAQVNTVWFF